MRSRISRLKSLISEIPAARRSQGYPDKVKELCVELAMSSSVKEVANHSGVSPVTIYKWIGDAKSRNHPSFSLPMEKSQPLRPMVLQEVEIAQARPVPEESGITIISAKGATVRLPCDGKTVAMILDRMIGELRC